MRRLAPWRGPALALLLLGTLLGTPGAADVPPAGPPAAGSPVARAARPAAPRAVPPAERPWPPGPPPAAVRRFSPAALQRLRDDDDLQYRESPPPDNPFARWLLRQLRRLFSAAATPGGRIFWKVLFYAIAAGALLLVVMQLLGLRPGEWLRGRGRRVAVPYATEDDNVHEETLPQRLREAEEAGHWRLATRLGYLLTLKALTDRDLIRWQPQKTNHHYDAELRQHAPALTAAFGALTWHFEYVWYGEFAPDAAQYAQVRQARQEFLSDLTSYRAA